MPGGGSAPQAQQVQPGTAAGDFLFGAGTNFQGVADPELQRRIIESEGRFRPQFAQLDVEGTQDVLFGRGGAGGIADVQRRVIEETGDPVLAALQRDALKEVNLGGQLSEGDVRRATQGARVAGQARGRLFDVKTAFEELKSGEELSRQRKQERRGFALQTVPLAGAERAQAFNLAKFGFQAQADTGPRLFDPDAGINLALANEAQRAELESAKFGAKQAKQGAIIGGGLGAIGQIFG